MRYPILAAVHLLSLTTLVSTDAAEKPNVLFVVIDDLNDWVGCLGGHPQAKTPHIDRLAQRGLLFTNAHCTASLCNPSRTSVMTGTLPSTNGVHGNQQDWRRSPYLKGRPTLPEYFRKHGYWTAAGGKIYHANHGAECGALNGGHGGLRGLNHPSSWTERFPSRGQQIPRLPVPTGRNFNGLDIWHWDWGAIDVPESATVDGQVSEWASQAILQRAANISGGVHNEPFFLAVGLYATHGPWYCPPAYFDRHPLDAIQLPRLNPPDDLDDVPAIAKRHLGSYFGDLHARVIEKNLYASAVQAYLAQISFADAMLGRVIDALDSSGLADDTVIVLWSDHGWHLGEKQKWHKGTNWEEGTRVPLIIVAPGTTAPGGACDEPVSLVDLFPTLIDLCGLPALSGLDGESLVPQLRDPQTPRDNPAYTVNSGRHQSVRSKRWRYIRYADGSEELYDHDADPTEYHNLANDPQWAAVKRKLADSLPTEIRRVDFRDDKALGPDGELLNRSDEPGFRPIFNGYDLTTWDGDPDLWHVEDGVLVGETRTDDAIAGNEFLIWRGASPGDFELRLQCRIFGENNSGVQYRSHERPSLGKGQISGYQLDVNPRPDEHGMLYEVKGRGVMAAGGQQVVVTPDGKKLLIGMIDELHERPRTADNAAGEIDASQWHDLTIIARGNHLVHQVDGQTVAEVWDHQIEDRSLKGLIAFQLHAGPQMRVEFRDLRLRDFPPTEPVPPGEPPIPDDAVEVHLPRRD